MKWSWIINSFLCCMICTSVCGASDPTLTAFAAQKRHEMDELAAHNHLVVSPEERAFFNAAETGDWDAVSNAFERIRPSPWPPPPEASMPAPDLMGVLFVPIHETWGAYATFKDWDRAMLQKFADGVLQSIPDGSIYFGGTDAGRFVITAIRDVAKSPDIFIVTPKFTVGGYMDYLQQAFGDRVSIPSQQQRSFAFQKYLEDVHAGRIPAGTDVTLQNGQISVEGAQGVMMINGILARMIFEVNRDKHEFYIEESYVIPWMYPYLTPHGLIMKINSEPVNRLTPEVVKSDNDFWNGGTKMLMNDPTFLASAAARMTFSKLRSAIAGIYAYRRMYPEAEYAFQQAIDLCPVSPEANFRLTDVLMQQRRFSDASKLIEKFLQEDPGNSKVRDFLNTIRETEKADARRIQLEAQFTQGQGDLNTTMELADIYKRLGMQQPLNELTQKLIHQTNQPPDVLIRLSQLNVGAGRSDMAAACLQKCLERDPTDAKVWLELAAVLASNQQITRAMQALGKAVELGGNPIRELARKEFRFHAIQNRRDFEDLTLIK